MIIIKRYTGVLIFLVWNFSVFAMYHNPHHTKRFEQQVARFRKENLQATLALKDLLNNGRHLWRYHNKYEEDKIATLIEDGADPNSSDGYGDTALSYACRFGLIRLVELLLQKGADPNQLNRRQLNAFMFTLKMGEKVSDEIFKLLVKSNLHINQCDDGGRNALRYAIHYDKPHIADLLIDAGADPEVKIGNKNAYEASAIMQQMNLQGQITPRRPQSVFFTSIGPKQKIP